jgi:hypothetical protein
MNIETTDSRRATYSGNKTIVYVDSNLMDTVDKDIFNKYVSALRVKSVAWASLIRKVNAVIAPAIKEHLKGDYKVRYSRKAGCKCGCSPGFIVTRHGSYTQPILVYKEMFVDVVHTEEEIESFREANYDKAIYILKNEALLTPHA